MILPSTDVRELGLDEVTVRKLHRFGLDQIGKLETMSEDDLRFLGFKEGEIHDINDRLKSVGRKLRD